MFGLIIFITQFSSLITHHSIFITHHSPLITLNTKVVWYHHSVSITHYFSHYLRAPRLSRCSFFFFQVPSNPNPVKKKKNQWRPNPVKKKKKKKKRTNKQWRRPNQWERRRKKKKKSVGQKLRLSGSLMCVWLQKCHWVMSYENWKQPKGVFSFHNS